MELANRLVQIYKEDSPDVVTVVLEADGFADLLERTEFLQRISAQDARIIYARARREGGDEGHRRAARPAREARRGGRRGDRGRGRRRSPPVKGQLVERRDSYASARAGKAQLLANTQASRHALEDHVASLEREQAAVAAPRLRGGSGVAGPIRQGSGGLIWPASGPISVRASAIALGPPARRHRHRRCRWHAVRAAGGGQRRDRRLGRRLRQLHLHPARRLAVHLLRPPVEHRRVGRPVGQPGPGHRLRRATPATAPGRTCTSRRASTAVPSIR